MNEELKKNLLLVGIACVLVFAGCWLYSRYVDDRARADSHDATESVQQAQGYNQSARNDIDDATDKIESAPSALDRGQANLDTATGRLDEMQGRADADAKLIDDSQRLVKQSRADIAEAKRILDEIDAGNKSNGTQTSRTP